MIIEHLKSRHLDFHRTRVIVDLASNQATFLIFNRLGQLVGYQKYNPVGEKKMRNDEAAKYFTYTSERLGDTAVWGFESLSYRHDICFIVEGIFDAIRLHNHDLPALATLGSNVSRATKGYLRSQGRMLIGILDNDENKAGLSLASICHDYYVVPDPFNDLGEMSEEALRSFLTRFQNPLKTT